MNYVCMNSINLQPEIVNKYLNSILHQEPVYKKLFSVDSLSLVYLGTHEISHG